MNKIEVARGLLKNPRSQKWREEYAKLPEKDRKDVLNIISIEEMGTGLPPEEFQSFWEFIEKNKKNNSE